MASWTNVRCPKCRGRAHWHTDDGITYCQEKNCDYADIPDEQVGKYQPPDRRGGTNG